MTARILRIELRRSAAPWAGAAVLGLALLFLGLFVNKGPMWHGPTAWNAQWMPMVGWGRFLLVVLWPVAVGAGALFGLRDSRSGMTELLRTVSRPTAARAAMTAGALALALTAGYLTLLLIGGAQVAATGGMFRLDWLPIALVGALALVAGGWLGMGAGRALPSPLTPPLAAGASLVVAVALWSATATGSNGEGLVPNRVSLLAPSLGEPRDPWVMVAGAVTAGQAAWLLGLAVAGFVLVAARSRIAKLGSVLPLAVGLLIALPLFPASAAATYVPDAAAKALVCTGSVCVTALHETRLPELVGPGTEALRKLEALPGTPARVEETATVEPVDGDRERSATAVLVDFETAPYRDARGEDLVRSMVAGAGTTPCKGLRHGDDEYVREQVARSVSAAWFMGEVKPLPGFRFLQDKVDQQIRPVWDAFRALPAAEQQARISALRAAALSCRGDLLDVLTHGGAR